MLGTAQSTLLLVLGVAALAMEVFALVDALRHHPDAYVAAGKRTKTFWGAILGVATAVGFVALGNVLSLRTLGDSDRIAAAVQAGTRLVVVGSGWIGLEVAAAADPICASG